MWLCGHELSLILSITNGHYCNAISPIASQDSVKGRPRGGHAILWHKYLAGMCKIVDYEDDGL